MSLALRHPSLFCKVVALSGRYDLTRVMGPFEDLFSGYYDEDIYFFTPAHFLPNLEDPQLLDAIRRIDITMAVGEQDPFHDSNRLLSGAFDAKGIRHRLAIWPGEAHRARHWREMVPHYL
jgi:esterase/lipase superfamily enzyme